MDVGEAAAHAREARRAVERPVDAQDRAERGALDPSVRGRQPARRGEGRGVRRGAAGRCSAVGHAGTLPANQPPTSGFV